MFDLGDAYLFAKVVEHGGFAAASRATGRPKSTLSKRLGALEDQLGVRLLQRNARGLSLTDAGGEFHRHIAAMLIEAETAETLIQGRLAEPSGTVRITAGTITAQYHLSAILPDVARALPHVRIMLHATDRMVDIVQESFDIALRDHHDLLPSSALLQRRIGFEPDLLVAAPAYIERCGSPSFPDALETHDGLMNSQGAGPHDWTLRDGQGRGHSVAARPRFLADDPTTLINAALGGLGIAALPRSLCAPYLASGALVRVLDGWTAGGATTTMLLPHRRGQLPSVRAVAEAVAGAMKRRLEAR